MEGYGYPYPPQYPPGRGPGGEFPDHGDGFGGADQYYGMNTLNDPVSKRLYSGYWSYPGYPDPYHYLPPPFFGQCGEPLEWSHPYYFQWPSCSKYRDSKHTKRSRSREDETKSRSRSRSKSRSRSRTPSRTSTRSHSRTRSRSASRNRELTFKEPGILDAFRVMYLTPSKHKKSTTKYLATKKRQDRITELLKSDGLGSKRWLFYPRPRPNSEPEPTTGEVPGSRDNCDQRIKVDGDFFRKYKKRKKVDVDAPIAKLKRWELILYQKLGFVQAV